MLLKTLAVVSSLLLGVFATSAARAQTARNGGWHQVTVPSAKLTTGRAVQVLLPPGFELTSETFTYPAIYLIGNPGESPENRRQTITQAVHDAMKSGSWTEPKIIVDTGITNPSAADADFLVKELVPWMEKQEKADPSLRFLVEPAGSTVARQIPGFFNSVALEQNPFQVRYDDKISAALTGQSPRPQGLPTFDRVMYWGSIVTLTGSQVCDLVSSQPLVINGTTYTYETNTWFQDKNKQFGTQGYVLKGVIFGGLVGIELLTKHLLHHKSMTVQRIVNGIFVAGNHAIAASTFLVCKQNVDLHTDITYRVTGHR